MSIMLRCGYNQGQPEFVQESPTSLATSVTSSQVGIVWGQGFSSSNLANQNEIINGLKQCSDVIREAGFPIPTASQYIYVENLLAAPGKGTITIADVAGAQVPTENGVSIAYGFQFRNIPHSTQLIQDTIQRLIQGFRERVLVPWPGLPPI